MRGLAVTLIGLGLGLVGVESSDLVPSHYRQHVGYVGVALCAAGAVTLAAWLLARIGQGAVSLAKMANSRVASATRGKF